MELPPSAHEPEAVRDLADRILAEGRFDRPGKPLPDRVLEWFGEQLGNVLGSFVGSGAGTLVAWGFVLGSVAFVIYLVVRHGRVVSLPAGRTPSASLMVELTRTPAEWLAEAEALEARGQWREGLRGRHRALVGELVRRGDVSERAGRTAGEHLRDVALTRPGVAPQMAAATELFEAAWYGDAVTGPAEAERFEGLSAQVLGAAVGRR